MWSPIWGIASRRYVFSECLRCISFRILAAESANIEFSLKRKRQKTRQAGCGKTKHRPIQQIKCFRINYFICDTKKIYTKYISLHNSGRNDYIQVQS